MIYLDNAATTFPKPECVYDVVDKIQRNLAVNAGRGSYSSAKKANSIIESVRMKLCRLTNATSASDVVITPSATIAMNEIIDGLPWCDNINVYVSPFEHNAVIRPLYKIANLYGIEIIQIPYNPKTQELDKIKMQNMFALKHPYAVFINQISNVTGLILDVGYIFNEAKKYNSFTILDASQSMGMIDLNVRELKADFTVFAGHKNLYSHLGVGGFIKNTDTKLNKVLCGGTGSDSLNPNMPENYPYGYEPASYNIISIASLNASLDWLMSEGISNIYNHKKELTEYAINKLGKIPRIKIYKPENSDNHIAIISFNHSDYQCSEIAEILDEDFNIAVRSGYHCAPYIHQLIGTIETFGTVRISFGYFNTKNDVDALISAIEEI